MSGQLVAVSSSCRSLIGTSLYTDCYEQLQRACTGRGVCIHGDKARCLACRAILLRVESSCFLHIEAKEEIEEEEEGAAPLSSAQHASVDVDMEELQGGASDQAPEVEEEEVPAPEEERQEEEQREEQEEQQQPQGREEFVYLDAEEMELWKANRVWDPRYDLFDRTCQKDRTHLYHLHSLTHYILSRHLRMLSMPACPGCGWREEGGLYKLPPNATVTEAKYFPGVCKGTNTIPS